MPFDILKIVFVLIPMILALTVHECAHALMAYKLGDDTAARMGRLTLNPISHIDPIGTLLIPIVGLSTGIPFFGWAKPVPWTPVNITRKISMKTGQLLVSAAGPVSNIIFASIMSVLLGIVGPSALEDILAGVNNGHVAMVRLIGMTLLINVGLFVFNLLPIPPLDGSKVLASILPERYNKVMEFLSQYSFVLFIGLLLVGGSFLGYPIFMIARGMSSLMGFDVAYALDGFF